MDQEVYTVVGLRDVFRNPERVWVVVATQSIFRPLILNKHLGMTNVLMMSSGFEENLPKESYPCVGDYCADTAENKARMVAQKIFTANDPETKAAVTSLLASPLGGVPRNFDLDKVHVVIGADTVAQSDGVVREKPVDREDARKQLTSYPDKYSMVYTGVAMFVRANGHETAAKKFYTTTKVKFQKLSPEDVEAVLDTGEYRGSAGSYKISGIAESLIEEIVGSYTNVIGLPAQSVSAALCDLVKTYNLQNF